jgi:regulatory protein
MDGVVTSVAESAGRGHASRDRADVYLDGAYAFSVQIVLAAELRVGQQLSASDVRALQARDATEMAYEATLRYLTYRPRSEQELERYLARKGVEHDVARAVIERLRRAGLADDRQFAEFWVQNREQFRPRGQWALRQELGQKGVRGDVAAQAVAEVDDERNALQVAERAASRYARVDRETFARRMMGMLLRRGFGYATARRAAEHAWGLLNPSEGDGE